MFPFDNLTAYAQTANPETRPGGDARYLDGYICVGVIACAHTQKRPAILEKLRRGRRFKGDGEGRRGHG